MTSEELNAPSQVFPGHVRQFGGKNRIRSSKPEFSLGMPFGVYPLVDPLVSKIGLDGYINYSFYRCYKRSTLIVSLLAYSSQSYLEPSKRM